MVHKKIVKCDNNYMKFEIGSVWLVFQCIGGCCVVYGTWSHKALSDRGNQQMSWADDMGSRGIEMTEGWIEHGNGSGLQIRRMFMGEYSYVPCIA